VTTRKTPQTYAALSTTAKTSLLLLGVWCGSALASTEIQAPSPELSKQTEAALHEILDGNAAIPPTIRTVDSSDVVTQPPLANTASDPAIDEHDSGTDLEVASSASSASPEITTRLPGPSANERPSFRRHMFRTDI